MIFDLILLGDMSWPPSIIVCDPCSSMTRLRGLNFPAGNSDIKAISTPPWALCPPTLTVALTTRCFSTRLPFSLELSPRQFSPPSPHFGSSVSPPPPCSPTTPSRMSPSLFYGSSLFSGQRSFCKLAACLWAYLTGGDSIFMFTSCGQHVPGSRRAQYHHHMPQCQPMSTL